MSSTVTVLLSQVLYQLDEKGLSTADVKDLIAMSLDDDFYTKLSFNTKTSRNDAKLAIFKILYKNAFNVDIDVEPLLRKYDGLRNWYLDKEVRLHYIP